MPAPSVAPVTGATREGPACACYTVARRGQIGRVAQLGERGVRNAEVRGSNPLTSTIAFSHLQAKSGSQLLHAAASCGNT